MTLRCGDELGDETPMPRLRTATSQCRGLRYARDSWVAGKLGSYWGSCQTHPTCYGAVRHMTTGSIQRDCWTGVERTHQGFLPSNFRSSLIARSHHAPWQVHSEVLHGERERPLGRLRPWACHGHQVWQWGTRSPMVTWGLVQWFKYLQMKTHTHVQICSMVLFQNLYDLYADNHTHTH